MARTKSDAGKKGKGSGGGRNSACKHPIPECQMPIAEFLTKATSSEEAAAGAPSKEPEINMEISAVATTTSASAACGSADTSVEEGEVEECHNRGKSELWFRYFQKKGKNDGATKDGSEMTEVEDKRGKLWLRYFPKEALKSTRFRNHN